jgi:FKBP-type peptidyl-prolyl cis-trans isomerase (trigger factor)
MDNEMGPAQQSRLSVHDINTLIDLNEAINRKRRRRILSQIAEQAQYSSPCSNKVEQQDQGEGNTNQLNSYTSIEEQAKNTIKTAAMLGLLVRDKDMNVWKRMIEEEAHDFALANRDPQGE